MVEIVTVAFQVTDRSKFLSNLQKWDEVSDPYDGVCKGWRADDYVQRREALTQFVNKMEEKLRKNEHKRNWREKPIKALFELMQLEIREFEVALEFFSVSEARTELPDISNFAMMLFDRLGMLDQDLNANDSNQTRS